MVTGACPYCGQIRTMELVGENEVTQEKINDIAMMQCNCGSAISEQKKRETIENAKADIETLFSQEDKMEEMAILLNEAVIQIVEHKIDEISLKKDNIKAKLSKTSKGTIKVERTITEKNALES